jgi:hypothetical protein
MASCDSELGCWAFASLAAPGAPADPSRFRTRMGNQLTVFCYDLNGALHDYAAVGDVEELERCIGWGAAIDARDRYDEGLTDKIREDASCP